MQWIIASDPSGAQAFADPSFWLNAGALGVIAGLFIFGYLHSEKELHRVETTNEVALRELTRQHEAQLVAQRAAHQDAMQRSDDQVRQLMLERDKSNAERNEAVGVMRDFTMMAGAVLNRPQPWERPRKGASDER